MPSAAAISGGIGSDIGEKWRRIEIKIEEEKIARGGREREREGREDTHVSTEASESDAIRAGKIFREI